MKDAFFDYDSVTIRDDAHTALTANAAALRQILADFPDAKILVEGHCDERGSAEYNLGLGDRRAAAAKELLTSMGIYGYDHTYDVNGMTAKLISQMIWYFVDGCLVRKTEAKLTERDEFNVFNITFTDNDTVFLKSKRTNRWWMKLPDQSFVPCSYNDYLVASNDQIPERWLREQERLL